MIPIADYVVKGLYVLIIQKTATNPCWPNESQWDFRDPGYKVTWHRCEPVYTVIGMGIFVGPILK